jgi:UDP-glucose 4-epimerase
MEILEQAIDRYGSNFTFNFVSSWFTYGFAPLPVRERDYYEPRGSYSATKQCAENLLKSTAHTYGFKYRIFRLANVYGKGDKWSKKKNALQYLINEIKHNRDIDLYYGGYFQRDYIHVDDVCRAIMYCIVNAPTNEIINIGSGNGYSFRTLMEDAIAFSGSKSKINYVEPPRFHNVVQVKDMRLDISKLKRLGFIPSISIRDGIRELCKDQD